MPTNDFIGFASAGSANVMSQADYAAAAEQTDGVQPGPASSALANKIWRQGANMASALGQMISAQGYNALDNGDIGMLKTALVAALQGVAANGLISNGTWTPTLEGSTTTGEFTYSTRQGNYLKIDKLVYIYCSISISSCSVQPIGRVGITGLPYVPFSDANSGACTPDNCAGGASDCLRRICYGYVGNSSLSGPVIRPYVMSSTGNGKSDVGVFTTSDTSGYNLVIPTGAGVSSMRFVCVYRAS